MRNRLGEVGEVYKNLKFLPIQEYIRRGKCSLLGGGAISIHNTQFTIQAKLTHPLQPRRQNQATSAMSGPPPQRQTETAPVSNAHAKKRTSFLQLGRAASAVEKAASRMRIWLCSYDYEDWTLLGFGVYMCL